jgi:hypothetical protein
MFDPIEKRQAAFFLCSSITNSDGTMRNVNFSMEFYKPGVVYGGNPPLPTNDYLYPLFLTAFQWLGNMAAPNGDLVVIVHEDARASIPPEHEQMMYVLLHFIEGYFNARVYGVTLPSETPDWAEFWITRDQVPGPVEVTLQPHQNTMLMEITPTTWSFRAKTLINEPAKGTYIDGIKMDEMEIDFPRMVAELVETHSHYYKK